jgi:hypothetical protein
MSWLAKTFYAPCNSMYHTYFQYLKKIIPILTNQNHILKLAQDKDRWRALVNAVMKIPISIKCREFLD